MKLQLILDGQEIELNEKVSIPLNKTFENLENPMDIVVDYSKSINIPMTSTNNNILANSYRLDRTIISGDETTNLGIYLDPTKKIPMKLLYNSSVVLDGYAKFVSANRSTKNQYYTLNLFGVIGDIFQKLKSVVLSESQLTDEQRAEEDGGAKYILHDRCLGGSDSLRYLNAEYVWENWTYDENNVYGYSYNPETGSTGGAIRTIDIIGFAPSYRGFYNEFNSNQIQYYDGNAEDGADVIMNIDDFLTEKWTQTYINQNPSASLETAQNYAESLGASDVVGDGIKDYQMREYRVYYLKPYIFFNQLLQMFQDHIKWYTDYKLELDTNWFNVNNPYWTRMCYMLDFLDSKDSNQDASDQITSPESIPTYTSVTNSTNMSRVTNQGVSTISTDYLKQTSSFVIDKFNIITTFGGLAPKAAISGWGTPEMTVNKYTYFRITIGATNNSTAETSSTEYIASFQPFENIQPFIKGGVTKDRYLHLSLPQLKVEYLNMDDYWESGNTDDVDVLYTYTVNIPIPNIEVKFSSPSYTGLNILKKVEIQNDMSATLFTTKFRTEYSGTLQMNVNANTTGRVFQTSISPLYVIRRWRDFIPITLENIYFKEDAPLFDIVLQYTKMFGLLWVPDYETKTIKLMHRNTFFKNYSIEDWSDKVDRSKDFIVEPITFGSRYVAFNYDNIDGFRYSGYKDKYGVEYGSKLVNTGYDFGYETKDLFKGISPSSASSKSYIDFYQWEDWDLTTRITPTQAKMSFIDCEDEDEKSAISIYNWYLKGDPKYLSNAILLTDDSPHMKSTNEYCWMYPAVALNNGEQIYQIPTFDIAINSSDLFPNLIGRTLGVTFNTPNEDYTYDKLPSKTVDSSIYNLFWENYINERYNVQNKKVTAYFDLSTTDYLNFEFNKFIIIDNQLFMVNKIFDYDLSNVGLSKVELIQVTNIDVYSNGSETFPQAVMLPTEVNVIGSNMSNDYGSKNLIAKVTALDENGELTRGEWGVTGRLTVYQGTLVDENDIMNNPDLATEKFVRIEDAEWTSNNGQDLGVLGWQDMDGSKFEGSVTYTVNDQVFEIPITIDYTI